ncbi:MAG: T9SS type A sorting domain-containing protein [Ignavibacteriaceae bacterium]|nr:T9SS type A sorting domain-containing protein [Ignavibacteriaceae bacterium]
MNTFLVTGSNMVFKTTDGGTNWTQITPGVPGSPTSRIRMVNDTTGYLIGGSGTSQLGYIFKTTNAGDTWTNTNFPYTGNMIYDIAFRSDSDYVVVGFGGTVFHTKNGGTNWEQYNLGLLNLTQSQVIGLTFVHQDSIIVGGAGGSLVKVAIEPIVPVELVSFNATVSNNSIILNWATATELNNQGFEIQKRAGNKHSTVNNWEIIGYVPGFGTTTEPKSYSFSDNNISTGTYSYRLKQIDYDGTYEYSNKIEVEIDFTPNEYALHQNYPNPFNPSTVIKYSLAQDGFVNIAVFNLLGEKVATLVNTTQRAGNYEVNFNASSFSSGIYFYSIETGDFKSVRKMLLMK